MPLRDHFHAPCAERNHWEGFHSAWANAIVRSLNESVLPKQFRAEPQVALHGSEVAEGNVCAVRVIDEAHNLRLAAILELVSPSNKNRADRRAVFVGKCAGYLQRTVGLMIVDIVTWPNANLHEEFLEFLAQGRTPTMGDVYAVAYRVGVDAGSRRLEIWPTALAIGESLPTLPLWLTSDKAVPVDLEATYAETCRVLRIGD
ncbi:MAG: DUF4058 family protein [Gemmataceae bacterium]